jgi:ribosomal protein S18 acetylase RimI-like enzyme
MSTVDSEERGADGELTTAPGGTDVEVDLATAGDYEGVVRGFSLLGKRYTSSVEDPATWRAFEHYLTGARGKVGLVARIEGEVVGTMLFEITPVLSPTHKHARADGLAVSPAYRNRGIGRRLLRRAFQIAAERGVTSFMIKASDPGVIELYRRTPELRERGVYFYYDPDPRLLASEEQGTQRT